MLFVRARSFSSAITFVAAMGFMVGCGKLSTKPSVPGTGTGNNGSGVTQPGDDSSNGSNGGTTTPPTDTPAAGYDVFSDVAVPVAKIVDNYWGLNELSKQRVNSSATNVSDTCNSELGGRNTFAERIAYVVGQKMKMTTPRVGYVSSIFGIPSSDESTYKKVSLISHPLCNVTSSTLNTAFEGKNVPSSAVIGQVNTFVNTMNGYRTKALAGDNQSLLKAHKLWTKMYMCLAYIESLTTADSRSQDDLAAQYGIDRPDGVNFNQQALLNVGLYQFDPDSGGDTQSCIREWNDQFVPKSNSCSISRTIASSSFVKVIGSSYQTFNAYCGVAKMISQFGVQVNTTKTYNVFPTNVTSSGGLVAANNRCVAFTINVNKSYNHFAGFQNGYGNTLGAIMDCTLSGAY